MDGRIWDRGAVLILALVCTTCLVAMTIGSCDTREQRRTAAVANAEARALSIARAMPAAIDDTTREQARQRLALEALEQRAAVQRESFEDYKDLTIYGLTIVGGLVALVGVLFPVGLYLVSLRPSQKVVDEARYLIHEGLEKRFEALLEKQRSEKIEQSIARLLSDDPAEQANAAQFFALNADVKLNDRQIFDLVQAMLVAPLGVQSAVANFVAAYDSTYVTRGLRELLKTANPSFVIQPVLRHCSLESTEQLRIDLKQWLAEPGTGWANATNYMNFAALTAPHLLGFFIDDAEWLARLPVRVRVQARSILQTHVQLFGKGKTIKDSALMKSVEGVQHAFLDNRFQDCVLSEAVHIFIYEDGEHKGTLAKGSKAFDDAVASLQRDAASAMQVSPKSGG